MPELKQISELERFYYEAKRIRDEWDQLIRDMESVAFPDEVNRKPLHPVLIDPRTGKPV